MQTRREVTQEHIMNNRPYSAPVTDQQRRRATIRNLNDALRQTGVGGRVMVTRGIAAMPPAEQAEVLQAVATFDDFDADNDPHGEHDFGIVDRSGWRVAFKLDYFDGDLRMASLDPADPAVTCRVLTIMLAEEY